MGGAKGLGLVLYRYSVFSIATANNSRSRISLVTTALGQPPDSPVSRTYGRRKDVTAKPMASALGLQLGKHVT